MYFKENAKQMFLVPHLIVLFLYNTSYVGNSYDDFSYPNKLKTCLL